MYLLSIPYIAFMTQETTADFWETLKAVLYVAMPLLLIWAATELGGQLLSVIRNAFRRDSFGNDNEKESQDRDYDI